MLEATDAQMTTVKARRKWHRLGVVMAGFQKCEEATIRW